MLSRVIPRCRTVNGDTANPRSRPLDVILTAMYSAFGAITSLTGHFFIPVAAAIDLSTNESAKAIVLGFSAILMPISVILQATVSYGLFTLQKWSYMLTLIVYTIAGAVGLLIAGAVGLLGVLAAGSWQGAVAQVPHIVAAVVIILYFRQPRIRAYFAKW